MHTFTEPFILAVIGPIIVAVDQSVIATDTSADCISI